jgi:hypothetical protein
MLQNEVDEEGFYDGEKVLVSWGLNELHTGENTGVP